MRTSKIRTYNAVRSVEVVAGAKVTVTTADARALYNLTEIDADSFEKQGDIAVSNDQLAKYEAMRAYLRKISEEILFIDGEVTDLAKLISLSH